MAEQHVSTHSRSKPTHVSGAAGSSSWIHKLGSCCHPRQSSIESIYHPERVDQPLPDLGPPTRSSLHLAPPPGDHEIDMDRLVPTSIRKSISYPDFSAESIALSDGDSSRGTPRRAEGSIHRLHTGLLKRLSRGSSAAGSASPVPSRRGHQVNMSQESINRRKELKRALHKRVTEELLEERGGSIEGAMSESEMPLVDSLDPGSQGDRLSTVVPLRSRKSSRSITAGLPPVAEDDYLNARPARSEEDRKSLGGSSWVTDLPSSGWASSGAATRKTSQTALISTAPRPPSEPIPELPEVFAKLKSAHDSSQTDPLDNSDYKPGRSAILRDESHTKHLSLGTRESIRDMFKPLEHSPKRLGLWLRGSTSSFGSRPVSLRASHVVDASMDNPSSTVNTKPTENSSATDDTQIHHLPITTFDGHADIIVLDNIRPKNDVCIERRPADKENAKQVATPLSKMRRMVKNVLESPFVLAARTEDKGHCVAQAASLPSLRHGRTQRQDEITRSPASGYTCYTLPVTFAAGKGLWDEASPVAHDYPPTPVSSSSIEANEQALNVGKRSKHQHSSSLQSSTASFRAREIAAVAKRIVSNPKSRPQRKNSKFKEDLDEAEPKAQTPETPQVPSGSPWRQRQVTAPLPQLDGPGDLQPPPPLQRSISYTVADFMQSQDTAGRVWERALQEHAFDIAHRNNESRKGSGKGIRPPVSRSRSGRPSFRGSTKGKERARDDASSRRRPSMFDEDISPGASPTRSPSSSPTKSHLSPGSPAPEFSFSPTPASDEEAIVPRGTILGNANAPTSWSRFPSHTRKIRNGAAGAKDQVNTYDFAGEDFDDLPDPAEHRHENTRNMELVQRNSFHPSSPIVRLPMGILQLVAKFSKTADMELAVRRSAHRGIRSSISAGGEVTAPELELLGLSTPAFHPMSALAGPEAPDLDRPIPPSPRLRGYGETDEVGRQLALPMDWSFGRRRSSTGRRPSRSDSNLAAAELQGPKGETPPRQDSRSGLLLAPPAEDSPLLQRPRAAHLASSLLSIRRSDEDGPMGRRRSKSHNGVLSDRSIELKPLQKSPDSIESPGATEGDKPSLKVPEA